MAVTTTTSLAALINSSLVDTMVLDYAAGFATVAPWANVRMGQNLATGTLNFPRWNLDTEERPAETDELVNTELTATSVPVTASEVGIRRDITKSALEDKVLTDAELFDFIVRDSGTIIAKALDTDLAALFPGLNGGVPVGATGVDLSIANMIEALATLRDNGVVGQYGFSLSSRQAYDFQASASAETGTIFPGLVAMATTGNDNGGFLGTFWGSEVWMTSHFTTANAGVDQVGACYVRGDTNPEIAPLGLFWKRTPLTETDQEIEFRVDKIVTTVRYGVGEVADDAGVAIVTDAD